MEKDLKDRIIKYFSNTANSQNDFIIPRQIGVFARREADFYTFGIPGGAYLNFYEEFNSCIMKTGLEGNKPYLYFSCKELSEEFVDFCLRSFIPPEKREEITSDPAAWFEKISAIFGNTNSSTATSDKIAELYVFWQMKRSGLRNISFGGYNKKSLRDIQCEGFEVEVNGNKIYAWKTNYVTGCDDLYEIKEEKGKLVPVLFCAGIDERVSFIDDGLYRVFDREFATYAFYNEEGTLLLKMNEDEYEGIRFLSDCVIIEGLVNGDSVCYVLK